MRAALALGRSFMYDYHPELSDYLLFHDTIDLVCWLTKLRYSSRQMIKSRHYRLDVLFDSFLQEWQPDIGKLRRLRGKAYSEEKAVFHLNKGWYNELVRTYPLEVEALEIGTRTSPSYSTGRPVAWNIVQSYYAIYEFVNSLVFSNTDNLRTEKHRKSTIHFCNYLLPKFSGVLIPYPFNITNPPLDDIETLRRGHEAFWSYKYARCPRDLQKSIFDIEHDYLTLMDDDHNLLNLLYRFRVWANYLGINTIIALQDGYYLSYLYKNLGMLCFFYACFAELMTLAVFGEDVLVQSLEHIATNHVLRQDQFKDNWYLIPMFIRFRMYCKHGLIHSHIPFLTPPSPDPITI